MRRGRPSTICSPQHPSSLRKNTAELDTDLATRILIPITAVLQLQFIQFIVAGERKEVLLCLIGRSDKPTYLMPMTHWFNECCFIHMFIQVVNVLTHWSSWRGSEVGTLEIKLQKVLHFKESHRHGHKAELEPGCQGLPHCPWGVGCHCRAYPWGASYLFVCALQGQLPTCFVPWNHYHSRHF